jgi:hypothetical protein
MWLEIRNEDFISRPVFVCENQAMPHLLVPLKHLLNFLKLDPKATDLDLLINTSKIFNVSSRKISGQIP